MVEGKTKQILEGPEPGTVVLLAKDRLTGGDAAKVAEIPGIGAWKTTQTANVFMLLANSGVPTAFIRQLDERSLLCADCEMVPVEYVVRRYGWGSYRARHPETPAVPTPFDELVVERFYKHALVLPPAVAEPEVLEESVARSKYLSNGRWAEGVHTDPYVQIRDDGWYLHSAKRPVPEHDGGYPIKAPVSDTADATIVQEILLPAFRAIEDAWRDVTTEHGPVVLVDCKFEIGKRRSDGALVLSDVVDNDSWRIWAGGDPKRQLDKQRFRDGAPLPEVANAYKLVAELTSRFSAE